MVGSLFKEKAKLMDSYLEDYFSNLEVPSLAPIENLKKSMQYSALNGGKRFRPALVLCVAEVLGKPMERLLPFAAAVEMVHTYSLIHDDLPIMDDDDLRRGQPTNHKVFGEDVALLAGDALIPEAYMVLTKAYGSESVLFSKLIELFSKAIGVSGMVGGQAIDLKAQEDGISPEGVHILHRLKTGKLIHLSIVGAAMICHASEDILRSLNTYAENLGLAFQIKDDLLDFDEKEPGSFPATLGQKGTEDLLDEVTNLASHSLNGFGDRFTSLRQLIDFNHKRSH